MTLKNIASYVEEVVNKAKDIDFDELYKDENPPGSVLNVRVQCTRRLGSTDVLRRLKKKVLTS